ncbi:hypothetical protein BCR39DRAFT_59992 [Naematelia encephala]|uniref:Uncharacterized protein n=1 Tax=Naematelia encephala TaxID=71784 RepID=A0A1Y2BBD7_9TREE|nr:hypothetical protein BCR39DRAFT_59992 [Naematelia encephala]
MDIDVDARVIEAAEQQERVREQGQDDSWLNQFRAYQQQQGQGQGQEQVQAQEQEHQHKASSSSARFTETFSSSRTQIDPPSSWSFDSSPSHTLLRLDHASSSSPSPSSPSSPSSHDRDNVDLGNSPSSPLSSSHSTLHPPRLSSSIRPKSKPIPIVLSHKGNSRSLTRHSPYPPVSSLRSTSSTMTPSTSARHTLPPSAHATPPSLSAAAAARLTSPTPSMSSSNRRRQAPLFPNSPRQDRDHVPATLTPTQTAAIPYSPFRSAYSHAPRPPRQVGVPITPRTASHLAHHPYRPPPSASAPSKLPDPAYPITGPYYLVPSPTRRNAKGEPEMDVVPAVPTAAAILHLKANAGKFWNAPESADIVLSASLSFFADLK